MSFRAYCVARVSNRENLVKNGSGGGGTTGVGGRVWLMLSAEVLVVS